MANLENIGANDNATLFRSKLNAALNAAGSIPQVSASDNASTLRARVNAVIDAVNNSGGESGGGSDTESDDVLNILCIGNSLTEDAWAYVPYMLMEYGIKVRMMIFRKASASLGDLRDHYYEPWAGTQGVANNGKMLFIDTTGKITDGNGNTATVWSIVYYENGEERFLPTANDGGNAIYNSCDYAVEDGVLWRNTKWDLIAIQDFQDTNNNPKTDQLNTIIGYIKDSNPLLETSVFALHVSPTFSQKGASYYHSAAFLARNRTMFLNSSVEMVISNCAAIANARQLSEYRELGAAGDLLADSIHLQEGLPCYISSLTSMEALFRRFYPWLSVDGDTSRPSDTWKNGKSIPNAQGATIAVTNDTAPMCQRFALLANDYPWEIIDEDYIRNPSLTVKLYYNLPSDVSMGGCFNKASNDVAGSGNVNQPKYSSIGGMISPSNSSSAVLGSCKMFIGGTWNGTELVGSVEYDLPINDNLSGFFIKEIKDNVFIKVTTS